MDIKYVQPRDRVPENLIHKALFPGKSPAYTLSKQKTMDIANMKQPKHAKPEEAFNPYQAPLNVVVF
jgi:hypothetical protein